MITIDLVDGDRNAQSYGIRFRSKFVYRFTGTGLHNPSSPHRVNVWDNTGRPNTDPDRFKPALGRKVGPGAYIDPRGHGTDHATSILTNAESTIMTDNGTNTGTEASGQVYADVTIRTGESVMLRAPDGNVTGPYRLTTRFLSDPVLIAEWDTQS